MKYLKYLLVFCMLFTCTTCFGQLPKPLEIRNLQGMNTRLPDFSRPPNVPTELINVDLRKTGSYGSREGYSVYYTPAGVDSIIGMLPLKFSDGEEMMVALVDPDNSTWGKLIAFTTANATRLDTLFFQHRYEQSEEGFDCFYPFVNANNPDCDLVMVVTLNDAGSITTDTIITIQGNQAGSLTDEQILDQMEITFESMLVGIGTDSTVVFDNYYRDSTGDTMYYVLDYNADVNESFSINFEWKAQTPFACDLPALFPYCQPDVEILYFSDASWTSSSYAAPEIEQEIIFERMPITNSFDAEIMNDVVYFASGGVSQVAWDRQSLFLNPPLRPAELWTAPYPDPSEVDAGYFLDGSYYYAVGQKVWTGGGTPVATWREPYVLTGPVMVDSGYVNIMGFQSGGTFAHDDASGIYDTLGAPDSVVCYLFRSRAYPEPLNQLDTLFKVYAWSLESADVASNGFDFDTLTCVDSLTDDHLDTDTFFIAVRNGELLGKGFDAAGDPDAPYTNFYGGPYYLGDLLDVNSVNGVDGVNTLIGWNDEDLDTLGWVYTTSFRDTISGLSSQFGPYLGVYTPRAGVPLDTRPAIISMQPNEELQPNCIVEFWKAPFYGEHSNGRHAVGHYTRLTQLCQGYLIDGSPDTGDRDWLNVNYAPQNITFVCDQWVSIDLFPWRRNEPSRFVFEYWKDWTVLDTFVVPHVLAFILMGTQEEDGDPQFRDTVFTWDEIKDNVISHPRFTPASSPTGITILGRSGDRMMGASGTRLWWSELNNVSYWGAYNNINLGASDGSDNITGFYSARGVLRVFGEDYSYNAYGESWQLNELSGKWGLIAPRSLANGIRGAYFLSNQGVVHETEGGELERKYDRKIISSPLVEFDKSNMSREIKKDGVGIVFDNKYILSIPANDETWVWDEIAEGWSKWLNFTMGGAAVKKDTLFFFKPNGNTIYSYATSHLDANNDVQWSVTLPPLFVDSDEEMVTDIGIWTRDTSVAEGVTVQIYGPNSPWDIAVDGKTSITLSKRQVIKALSPYSHLPVSTIIKFTSQANLEDGQVFIDGIDIFYKKMNVIEAE